MHNVWAKSWVDAVYVVTADCVSQFIGFAENKEKNMLCWDFQWKGVAATNFVTE